MVTLLHIFELMRYWLCLWLSDWIILARNSKTVWSNHKLTSIVKHCFDLHRMEFIQTIIYKNISWMFFSHTTAFYVPQRRRKTFKCTETADHANVNLWFQLRLWSKSTQWYFWLIFFPLLFLEDLFFTLLFSSHFRIYDGCRREKNRSTQNWLQTVKWRRKTVLTLWIGSSYDVFEKCVLRCN